MSVSFQVSKFLQLLNSHFIFIIYTGRIVIATGLPEDKGHKTEVLDLINPSQKFNFLEDIPSRWGSAGGLVQNKPMIAGGYVFDTYFQDFFVIGDYENKKTMVYER